MLFEPSALWSSIGHGPPPDFARDRDVVYAPHLYTGGFDGGPITAAAFKVAVDEARGFGGAPILSGEWGADPARAKDPSDGYFLAHQALQDRFGISATLWTWRESCGDPHKVADYRAGRRPRVWGEFAVDCTTGLVNGVRRALVDQLTRGYVRAAPAGTRETEWDATTRTLRSSGNTAGTATRLLAFVPITHPKVTLSGVDAVHVHPAPGGGTYITARAHGGSWFMSVRPAS
jgi:endoglycosylceramidase